MNVFLSYRREDSAGHTGRLHDRLTQRWSPERVFWDIDNIEPGEDFVEVIDRTLAQCAVVLVIIGPRWLEVADADGRARIADPSDVHRIEIERALDQGIRVIPVLVGNARMPSEASLPDTLKRLARRNAVELDDKRFNYDAEKLAASIERGQAVSEQPESPLPLTLAPAAAPEQQRALPRSARFASALVGGAIFVAAMVFFAWPTKTPRDRETPVPAEATSPVVPSQANAPSQRADEPASPKVAAPELTKPPSAPPRSPEADHPRTQIAAEKSASRPKITAAPRSGPRNTRCSDVLNRLQIGDAVSEEEQALFNKECRR